MRIIAIDNDTVFLTDLSERLREDDESLEFHGISVDRVDNAAEHCAQAVESILKTNGQVDLVLLDIVFDYKDEPDLEGHSVAAKIHATRPDIPIVALTGFIKDYELLVETSLNVDFDGIVPKQWVRAGELSRPYLRRICEKAKKRAELRVGFRGQSESVRKGQRGDAGGQATMPEDSEDRVDVAVTCALHSPELSEVLNIGTWREVRYDDDPTTYYRGVWKDLNGRGLAIVAAAQQAMGMTSAASLAAKNVLRFGPRYVAHVGIAGGVECNVGDVLFASSVYDYAAGKISDDSGSDKFVPHGDEIPIDEVLIQHVNQAKMDGTIMLNVRRALNGGLKLNNTELLIGPFACGSSVVSSRSVIDSLKAWNRKVTAVDMESYGVVRGVRECCISRTPVMIIKGASDSAVGKTDDGQAKAAAGAARFLYEFCIRYCGPGTASNR